jgi:hypothetical protein
MGCCARGGRGVVLIGMLRPTGHVIKRLQSGHIKNKDCFLQETYFYTYVPFCVNARRISCFRDTHTTSATVKSHQWDAFH